MFTRGLITWCCAIGGLVTLLMVAPGQSASAGVLELDATFSGDGRRFVFEEVSATTAIDVRSGKTYAVGVDGDTGKVFVARTDDDGKLDASFSADGVARLTPPSGAYRIAGLWVDEDSRTYVAAQSGSTLTVARFTASGQLDEAFSGDGVRQLVGGAEGFWFDPNVIVDSAGRVVVAAMVESATGSDVVVYRFLATGANDDSFSDDGLRRVNRGDEDWMDGVTVDASDRVLLGTDTVEAAGEVIRFTESGSLDTAFSGDGSARVRLMPGRFSYPVGLAVGDDHTITVAATSGSNLYGSVRFRPKGILDTSYGDGGAIGIACKCRVFDAHVISGRVVLAGTRADRTALVTRIGADATSLSVGTVDLYPSNERETVGAVSWTGTKVLVGGVAFRQAYVARVT